MREAYTLRREGLVPGLDLRQSCVSLPAPTRGELDVDASAVELRLVQAQGSMQRRTRRELEKCAAFGLGHRRARTGELGRE
jgi:hypothetical protein